MISSGLGEVWAFALILISSVIPEKPMFLLIGVSVSSSIK